MVGLPVLPSAPAGVGLIVAAPLARSVTTTSSAGGARPVFTVAPSIGGVPRIGQVLTGMDGTITGGTVVSRRWLLGAAVVSTAQAYLPTAIGALVYEVTATGPGGTTVASSAAVTVAAALPVGPVKLFGPFGFNPDAGQKAPEGNGFVYIDMARSSRPWQTDFNQDPATGRDWVPPTINGNGYPTSLNPHKGSCFSIINAEGRYVETPGIQKMVLLCSLTDVGLGLSNDCTITSNEIVGGIRRMEIDLDPTKSLDLSGKAAFYATTIYINSLPTPFRCKSDGDAVDDYISFFRADNEAKFLAGQEITDQAIARAKKLDGGLRMMDWCWVNQYQDLATYPTRPSWSWAGRSPLATMVHWANLSDVALWVNLPWHVTDPQATEWGTYVEQNLNSHLQHACEQSNEVWNFMFDQAHAAYDESQFTTQDGRENWRYGYRATQVMAAYHKGAGYSDRCTSIMGSRQEPSTTERIISGSKVAIAEWATPGNPNYNAEYADKFWAPGQIFGYGAVAMYLAAGFDQLGLSAADQAWVEGLANQPDGGVAAVIDQFRNGGHIATPLGDFIRNLVNVYAPQKAIFDREQMGLIAYEAMPALQQCKTATMYNIVYRAIHDPAFEPVMEEFCDAMQAAGVQATMFLTDIGEPNGAYGLLEGPRTFTLPRWEGAIAAQARGPQPLPLSVTVDTDGQTKVGKKPVTNIKVLNNWGKARIEVTGLVDGRSYDGWRGIVGTFQKVTAQPVTARVKVTDGLGRTAYCDLVQDIGAAPVYPTAKYARLVATEGFGGDDGNRGYYVALDSIKFVPADGSAAVVATWTGDGQSPNGAGDGPAANLAETDNHLWVSNGPLVAGAEQVFAVLPAPTVIEAVSIVPTDLRNCPAKWKLWLSDTPFASDGSGGRLMLDVNEANYSRWTRGQPRIIEIDPSLSAPTTGGTVTPVPAPAATALPSGLVNRLMTWDMPAQADGSALASATDSAGGVFTTAHGSPKYRTGGAGGKSYVQVTDGDLMILPTANGGAGGDLKALIESGTFTAITFVEQVGSNGRSIGAVMGSYADPGSFMLTANGQRAGFYYDTESCAFSFPWTGAGMLSIAQVSNAAYPFQASGQTEALNRLYLSGGCIYGSTGQKIKVGPEGLGLFGISNNYDQGYFSGRYYGHLFFNRALSPAEMKQVQKWFCEQTSQPMPWAGLNATYGAFGNSLDDGYGTAALEYTPMAIAAAAMGLPLGAWDNLGVNGQNTAGMKTTVASLKSTSAVTGITHKLLLGEYYNSVFGPGSITPQQTAANIGDIITAFRNVDSKAKLFVQTPTNTQSDVNNSHAKYDAFIAALLALPADGVVRLDQDPHIGRGGDVTDATYYQGDQLHLTGKAGACGYQAKANAIVSAFTA